MVSISNVIVAPEDEGTGVTNADWASAGHVSGLLNHDATIDYVTTGMNFQNVSSGTFDISSGLAYILVDSTIQVQDANGDYLNDWDNGVLLAIEGDTTTGISYDGTTTNYVFIDVDLTSNNSAEFIVKQSDSAPVTPSLKIGEIDSNDNVTTVNRQSPLKSDIESQIPTTGDGLTETGVTFELDESFATTWTSVQTFNLEQILQEISTPSSAPSGYNKLYFKSDDNLYTLDENGTEKKIARDESIVDLRENILDMQIQVARLNFETGLETLGFDNGDFEVYADADEITGTTNTNVIDGSEVEGRGYTELQDGEISGSVTHLEFDVEVIPDEIVVVDEMFDGLPSKANVTHTITDENGNSISFDRSDIDSVIDASSLNTFRLKLETTITRDTPSTRTPKVDSWGVYASGDQPSGDYFDAEQVGVPARTELYVSDDPTATTDFQINSTTVR